MATRSRLDTRRRRSDGRMRGRRPALPGPASRTTRRGSDVSNLAGTVHYLLGAVPPGCGGGRPPTATADPERRAEGSASAEAPAAPSENAEPTALSPAALEAVRTGTAEPNAERYRVPADGAAATGAGLPLVTLIVFSDFECPFCARVAPTLREILARYPTEVRLVFRHNPLPFHRHARPRPSLRRPSGLRAATRPSGATTTSCSRRPRSSTARPSSPGGTCARDRRGRRASGVDEERHRLRIENDQALAERFQARGTPYHFVNGRPLPGAQPFERFDELIRSEIAYAVQRMDASVPRQGVVDAILAEADGTRMPQRRPPPPPRSPEPDPDTVYLVPVDANHPSEAPPTLW